MKKRNREREREKERAPNYGHKAAAGLAFNPVGHNGAIVHCAPPRCRGRRRRKIVTLGTDFGLVGDRLILSIRPMSWTVAPTAFAKEVRAYFWRNGSRPIDERGSPEERGCPFVRCGRGFVNRSK